MNITPRIICPKCELTQPAAIQCRRCEIPFSYPLSANLAEAATRISYVAEALIVNFAAVARDLDQYKTLAAQLQAPVVASEAQETLFQIERRAILSAVERCGGRAMEAARSLGIGKTTVFRKLKEYKERDLRT